MALREFRIADDAVACHDWTARSPTHLTCRRCRAIVEVRNETHYLMYPPDASIDCSRSVGAVAPSRRADVVALASAMPPRGVEVEIGSMRLRFSGGSDPAYVAAVLRALGDAR